MITAPVVLLCQYPGDVAVEPAGGWQLPQREDQQRLQRFSSLSAKAQFALSRLLLAEGIAALLNGPQADWVLRTQSGGQPLLCHRQMNDLSISISHTEGLVAIAMAPAGSVVGVDVEAWSRSMRLARLLEACMDEQDASWCMCQSQPTHAFLQHWTLKEAYLKSLGKGTAIDLKALSFGLDEGCWALRATPFADHRCWNFEQLSLLPDYCISLAYGVQQAIKARWQAHPGAKLDQSRFSGCQLRLLQYS